MRHMRISQIQKTFEKARLPFISHCPVFPEAVGGNLGCCQFRFLSLSRPANIGVERSGMRFRNQGRVPLEIFQSVPQETVGESEDELAVSGVFQQAERRLVNGPAVLHRRRFSRLEPICQGRFEIGMAIAVFQGPLNTGGRSDELCKLDVPLTLG